MQPGPTQHPSKSLAALGPNPNHQRLSFQLRCIHPWHSLGKPSGVPWHSGVGASAEPSNIKMMVERRSLGLKILELVSTEAPIVNIQHLFIPVIPSTTPNGEWGLYR